MQRPPEGRALRGGQLFREGVPLEEESSIFTLKARAALKRIDMNESERSELGMKSLLERVKGRNRNAPGKARVAVARELAELAHLLLSRRVLFTETPPPRPGSPKPVAAANRAQRGKRASSQSARKHARKRKRRPSVTSKG